MPCSPINLNVTPPPSGPATPGFGIPFALPNSDNTFSTPTGFPEDLLGIVNALSLILPSGAIKGSLSVNYGKDVLDDIMSLMDKFMPVLMLYKMFLPVLNIIICVIEVICSLINPFALIAKIQRLFRVCIPEFLALFPIFAIIIMLLSILFLLISLIEYIIAKVLALVELVLANITALTNAFQFSDQEGVAAITQKLGLVICAFQNLFVMLVIFSVIIDVIKEILKLISAIPPCSGSDNSDTSCCGPSTCPTFIKDNTTITSNTGSLQYFNEATQGLASVPSGFPANFPVSFFNATPARQESWQFYDADQSIATAFYNITHAFDLPSGTNIIFFPTDANYTASTPINQVPYLLSATVLYNPSVLGRTDPLGTRLIQINNCIVLSPPIPDIMTYNNSLSSLPTGVLEIAGGLAYENDGKTPVLLNGTQATLNTLIHLAPEITTSGPPVLLPTDGYLFSNVSYTFTIQHEILFSKGLITLGCIPSVGLDRTFVNTVFGGNAAINFAQLNSLSLPDVAGAQQCLSAALSGLASNVSTQGVATFQATATTCLSNLQDQAISAIGTLLGLGFDPYKSTFTVTPTPQFTSEQITVQVSLKETNGQAITAGLPPSLGSSVAARITATVTFGHISTFVYDGSQFFNAEITSTVAGSGTVQVSFDGIPISSVSLPSNLNVSPSTIITSIPYTFIYSSFGIVRTGIGDTDGKPQLNE